MYSIHIIAKFAMKMPLQKGVLTLYAKDHVRVNSARLHCIA